MTCANLTTVQREAGVYNEVKFSATKQPGLCEVSIGLIESHSKVGTLGQRPDRSGVCPISSAISDSKWSRTNRFFTVGGIATF